VLLILLKLQGRILPEEGAAKSSDLQEMYILKKLMCIWREKLRLDWGSELFCEMKTFFLR
jgi:hypothetical protein